MMHVHNGRAREGFTKSDEGLGRKRKRLSKDGRGVRWVYDESVQHLRKGIFLER